MAAAGPDSNLGCTESYPDPRNVTFGLCVPFSRALSIGTSPFPTLFTRSLRDGCGSQLECSTGLNDYLESTVDPGEYQVVIEGYGPVSGELNVAMGRPSTGVFSDCCDAQQTALDYGPLGPGDQAHFFAGGGNLVLENCGAPGLEGWVSAFSLSAPAQATFVRPPAIGVQIATQAVRSTCDPLGADLRCEPGPGIFSLPLSAGTHYLVSNGPAPSTQLNTTLILEPIPPPPTNLDCATATTLTYQVQHAEARVVGGTPDPSNPGRFLRFYQITLPQAFFITPKLHQSNTGGFSTFSMRSVCDDPTSEFADGQANGTTPTLEGFAGPPAGTYWIVVSADEGAKYTLEVL